MSLSISVSKTFIGGAGCWEFVSEAPAAEEMSNVRPCRMQQRTVQAEFKFAILQKNVILNKAAQIITSIDTRRQTIPNTNTPMNHLCIF